MRVWVQAYFVHERLLLGLLNDEQKSELDQHIRSVERLTSPEGARAHGYETLLGSYFDSFEIPELAVLASREEKLDNTLVSWTQRVYLRNEGDNVFLHAPLDVDRGLRVESRLTRERLLGSSARSEFSGQRRVTVLGFARRDADDTSRIELTTIFAGNVDFSGKATPKLPFFDDRRELAVQLIDQLSPSSPNTRRITKRELDLVAKLPEETVKQHFADIIGETAVSRDWGGERSDLFTDKLTTQGVPLTAAFAFKGPGQAGRLTVARMGKNGDQGLRLAEEPCDLMVVQHHREIDSQVRNLMSAVARSTGRRFSIIDGAETARILRDFGKL